MQILTPVWEMFSSESGDSGSSSSIKWVRARRRKSTGGEWHLSDGMVMTLRSRRCNKKRIHLLITAREHQLQVLLQIREASDEG